MLTAALKCLFGQGKFKSDVHEEAAYAIFQGKQNVCIRMPPMFGKSFCYQLPAILRKGKIAIIIAPTSFHVKDLMQCLKQQKLLSYIIIEEADCISKVGPNFKHYYERIKGYKHLFYSIPVVMVTTVGTKQIMEDVFQTLGVLNPIIFSAPIFCPSVYYDVWFLDTLRQPFDHLKKYIVKCCGYCDASMQQENQNKSIIYCKTKDVAETIASTLSFLGIPTIAYHTGLKYKLRTNVKNTWLFGKVHVIAVTTDLANDLHEDSVRCVIHWMIPESISKYYMRTANTNLHMEKVFCRIYFSNKEYSALTLCHKEESTSNRTRVNMKKRELLSSISFCLMMRCRHVFISKYFGENLSPCKSSCDICYETEQTRKKLYDFKSYIKSRTTLKYTNVYANTTPQIVDNADSRRYSDTVKPAKSQLDQEIECTGKDKNIINYQGASIRIIFKESEDNSGMIYAQPSVQRYTNKFRDTLEYKNLEDNGYDEYGTRNSETPMATKIKECQEYYFGKRNNSPSKFLLQKNQEHTMLKVTSDVDTPILRDSKRKVDEVEDIPMCHGNKKHKYENPRDTFVYSNVDHSKHLITAAKTRLDMAKYLMIKYNLNDSEISLVPRQTTKCTVTETGRTDLTK